MLRILVCACLGAAFCDAQTPPTRVMPLGDSLTSGTTVEGAYRNPLHDLLAGGGFNVDFVGTLADADNPSLPDRDHQGMGGYRIDQLRAGLPAWLDAIEDPDVVLLMIGTNDFSANYQTATAPDRLAGLISEIATRRPFARIIVASLPPRTDDANLEALQAAFNAAIPGLVADQAALGRHVSFVDMHAALQAGDFEEGVHPSAAGYQKMAETWFAAITGVTTPLGTADPPAIARTGPAEDLGHLTITFSKPVADSAADIANFAVDGGVSVSAASLDPVTKRSVTLTTSPQSPSTLYTVTVNGVSDRTSGQHLIAADTTAAYSSLTLTNGSFENGETGWSMTGNYLVFPTTPPYLASNGTNLLVMNGGQSAPNALISQSFGTVPGQSYRLDYDLGILALNGFEQRLGVQVSGTNTLFAQVLSVTGNGLGNSVWSPKSHTFVADSPTTTLAFGDLSPTSNSVDLLLDHVRVTAIPAPANSAPIALADSYATPANTLLSVPAPGVLGNDSDAQSDPLAATQIAGPSHGSLTLNADGGFTYTPDAGYTGPDSFTYQASDGNLASNAATVSLLVTAVTPGVLVNGSFENGETGWNMTGNYLVYGTNPPYVAADGSTLVVMNGGQSAPNAVISQSFATIPGRSYTLEFRAGILANNTSVQRLGVEVTGTSSLLSLTESLTGNGLGNSVWSTKNHSFVADSGTTTLTFRDLSLSSNGADLLLDHVTVTEQAAPNTAPTAPGESYQTDRDTPLAVAAPGVLANDSDAENSPLAAILVSGPAHGSLTLNADGGFTYTPDSGYLGADSFTYRAGDGELTSEPATVGIDVLATNTAPAAEDDAFATYQNTALVIPAAGVLANDSDAEADPLTAILVSGPDHGSLTLNADGGFTYTPHAGYSGADAFTYLASDGELDSSPATVSLNVIPATSSDLLVNGSFESGHDGWTATGNQSIESAAPYPATDGVRLVAFNSGGLQPDATLSQSFATVPGETYTLTFDAGVFSYLKRHQKLAVKVTGTRGLLSRTFSIKGPGGGNTTWTSKSYTFVADDVTATLSFRDRSVLTAGIDLLLDNVRITGPAPAGNPPPVAVADTYSTRKDTPLFVMAPGLLENDYSPQAGAPTAELVGGPASGSLYLNADGGFTYYPNSGFTGTDSFTYRARSGSLGSSPVTVTLAIQDSQPGLLVNPSFEDGFNGWTADGNLSIETYPPTDGRFIADFNSRNRLPDGALTQSFATIPGQRYSLDFDAGILAYTHDPQVMLVTVSGSGELLSDTVTLQGAGDGVTRWTTRSLSFVADGTSTTLAFRDQSVATVGIDLLLDNVRVLALETTAAAALPDVRLDTPSLTFSEGAPVVRIAATHPGNYLLERSDDLIRWIYVDERQCEGPEMIEFHDSPADGQAAPRMFYRIGYRVD